MKKIITILIILTGILSLNLQAEAQTFNSSYYTPYMYQYQVGPYTFTELGTGYGSGSDEPKVDTEDVDDIEEDSAELNGEVDMNDYRDGIVFFVYGQDEDMVEDTERDYDTYKDVKDDEEDDDFEVVRVDRDLDRKEDYSYDVRNLEEDERYYVTLCVEYEDGNDERLSCGSVEDFETDSDRDDEPDAETESARDISDDSADIRGEIDMNDYDNGVVFFAWGEDEDDVEDIENENEFDDIDEQGDDLQVQIVDVSLDGRADYERTIRSLDDNTDIYYRICVEYEDDDNDEDIVCGDVEEFETD